MAEARRNFLRPGAQCGLRRGARVWKLLAWAGVAETPVPLLADISQIPRRIGGTPGGVARNATESCRRDQPALRVAGRLWSGRDPANACRVPTRGEPSLEGGTKAGAHDRL